MDNKYCDQKITEFQKEIESISKIIPTILDRLDHLKDECSLIPKVKEALINTRNGELYPCPGIETIKTYQDLFEVQFLSDEELVQLEKLHSLFWHVNDFDYRLRNSEWKHFDGDILITDPCYLKDNNEMYSEDIDLLYDMVEKYGMWRDTIYGDWSCSTFDADTKNRIGRFCADSGNVCVIPLNDVLKFNPNFTYHIKREWTTTWIKDFHGDVRFIVNEEHYEYEGKDCIDYAVQVEGKGNINFITSQTGL